MIHPLLVIAILIAMLGCFSLLTLRMAEKLKYERPYVIRRVMNTIGAGQLLITLMMIILVIVIDTAKLWGM